MKDKKPFYKVGDLLETRDTYCQSQYDYVNKLCLVLNVFEREGRYRYEVKIVNYKHFPSPHHGEFYDPPFETIRGDRSHVILPQHNLRKMKKKPKTTRNVIK